MELLLKKPCAEIKQAGEDIGERIEHRDLSDTVRHTVKRIAKAGKEHGDKNLRREKMKHLLIPTEVSVSGKPKQQDQQGKPYDIYHRIDEGVAAAEHLGYFRHHDTEDQKQDHNGKDEEMNRLIFARVIAEPVHPKHSRLFLSCLIIP